MSKLRYLFKELYLVITLFVSFVMDALFYIKHSTNIIFNSDGKNDTRILLLIHSIEKGLSFRTKKEGFGKEKISALINLLFYKSKIKNDDLIVLAINIIDKYFKDPASSKDHQLREKYCTLVEITGIITSQELGGVHIVAKPRFSLEYDALLEFYKQRRSIREFDKEKIISDLEINNAIEIANTTPTACNRQTSRVYVIKDRSKMHEILNIQLGDQGWGLNASVLFLITGDQSRFGGVYERSQVYIDGGLYAMNFVMGLHAQKIASCYKMYIRDYKIDKKMRNALNIPKEEVPIVLILAGHYREESVAIPQSVRITNKIQIV